MTERTQPTFWYNANILLVQNWHYTKWQINYFWTKNEVFRQMLLFIASLLWSLVQGRDLVSSRLCCSFNFLIKRNIATSYFYFLSYIHTHKQSSTFININMLINCSQEMSEQWISFFLTILWVLLRLRMESTHLLSDEERWSSKWDIMN